MKIQRNSHEEIPDGRAGQNPEDAAHDSLIGNTAMSELQCLIYISTASSAMGPQDLALILEKSEELNQRDGVHGMLLMSDGNFMQCIEGERAGVEATYARILASPLHQRVIEMFRSPVARRRFSNWDWAFQLGTQREFSNPETAQFLEAPRHDQPVIWKQRAMEQKILREFWDSTTKPQRIW
jgi:hypothetical protein